jgi:hypothetical protein
MQEVIREAKIIDIDLARKTCKLDYGDGRASEFSTEVPLPNLMGPGNNGLINMLQNGTRVLVGFVGSWGTEAATIIGVYPSLSQNNDVVDSSGLASDLPLGSRKYPTLKSGEVMLSSHSGPQLYLKGDREMSLADPLNRGLFFNFAKNSHSIELVTNNNIIYNSGGRLFWGDVRRNRLVTLNSDDNDSLNYNKDILLLTDAVGFFSEASKRNEPNNKDLRNLGLSEYRMIINEFGSDTQFSGFEDEYERIIGSIDPSFKNEKKKRYLDPTNLLGLSHKELIEIVAGNLIDINGKPLNINYNYIKIGDLNNLIPKTKEEYIDAVRKSRRGIGYHFQLNTNSFKSDVSTNLNNFLFDIDKEGIFKLHIPKSSKTGNIVYPVLSNYECGNDSTVVGMSQSNKSKIKPIPVTLRNSDGSPAFSLAATTRSSGIRFSNNDPNPYFKGTDDVRINKTKHHNIYEMAERLIGNTITKINIPTNFVKLNEDGDKDLFATPDEISKFSGYNYFDRTFEIVEKNDVDLQYDQGYSTVSIQPGNPAIKTGGKTFFAGKSVTELNKEDLIQSNYYKTKITDNKISLEETVAGQVSTGGVSANMDFEGSVEVSVGSDEADGKSIVLDTAGSLLVWLGKDSNNRSLVLQSDGSVLMNIGGSYSDSSSKPQLNPGRFDLRVNVTDRGFYSPDIPQPDTSESVGKCDYIISISESGLVICGGTEKPLLLRNKGEIMIESESNIALHGKEINFITPGREPLPLTKLSKNKQR